jgi:hypothetical protein
MLLVNQSGPFLLPHTSSSWYSEQSFRSFLNIFQFKGMLQDLFHPCKHLTLKYTFLLRLLKSVKIKIRLNHI